MKRFGFVILLFILEISMGFSQDWKRRLPTHNQIWSGFVSPLVADLDHDGKKELVSVVQTGEGRAYWVGDQIVDNLVIFRKLYIFDCQGELIGENRIIGTPDPFDYPTIADINNDGFLEIVVHSWDILENKCCTFFSIFNHKGDLLKIIKFKNCIINHSSLINSRGTFVIKDINNDKLPEIIFGASLDDNHKSRIGSLCVINKDGKFLPGFPVQLECLKYTQTPAVGNLDNDRELEIVTISEVRISSHQTDFSIISAFDNDGKILWSQKFFCDTAYSDPVIGDVNADGYNEVVFASDNGIYILDNKGNLLLEKPIPNEQYCHSNVSLADMDGDSDLEIVVGYDWKIYGIHHDGTECFAFDAYAYENPIVVGDVNGDGSPDILHHGREYIWAYDTKGNILPGFGWVRETKPTWYNSPTLADLDNDGDIEVISGIDNWQVDASFIYVWDLKAKFNPSTCHWPMYQKNPQHTGCYTEYPCLPHLKVDKKIEKSWILKKTYADIRLTIDNPHRFPGATYTFYRCENDLDYQILREIRDTDLQDGVYHFLDQDLEMDQSYSYKVLAYDVEGKLIGASNIEDI